MGCSSSVEVEPGIQPAPNGRINVRLLMNPVDTGDNRRPQQTYQSISHYRDTPTLSLEQVCQRLQIKDLASCISKAKNYSRYPKKGLQQDEQAAINLYTQQTQFYQQLNNVLRQNDERALMPWHGYLKLFLTALNKLPPYQGTVWRGVKKILAQNIIKMMNMYESPNFLGATEARTLFNIEVFDGRLVSEFSEFASEDEILLLPGTRVRVISVLKQPPGLHIIHLKQIKPSYSLFEPSEPPIQPFQPAFYYQPQPQYHVVDDIPSHEYSDHQSTVTPDSLSAVNTQIQLAKGISSDSEKAKVLKHVLDNKNLTDQMIAGVADCAKTIYDSDEKAGVLTLIARRPLLSDKQFRVSVAASGGISDDDQKARTLIAFLVHEQFAVQHLDVVLSSTGTIYAGEQKASVFLQLIRNRYLNAKSFPSVLNGIKGISTDDNKSEVLCQIAPRLPKNDSNVRQAYLSAASSIYSSEEKAAATMAFTSDSGPQGAQQQKGFFSNVSDNMSTQDSLSAFETQIQLAKGISSDSEKAKVLKHVLDNKNLTDQMIAGVADCAKTIYDSDEKAGVLTLIARRSMLSDKQFRVSVAASGGISDDDQKARTLIAFLVHEQFAVQHLDVVLSSTGTIYAGEQKASVFLQLIRNRYLNAKSFPSVLNGIKGISTDDDKSEVLCQIAPRLPKNDSNVRQAYLSAASSIYSSEEKAAATMAFI